MAEEAGAKEAPVPEWAVKILRQSLRDMRYRSFIMQGSHDELVLIEVGRGNDHIGVVEMRHWLHAGPPGKHDLPIVFKGAGGDHEERFTPHGLKQMQEFAPVVVGRICKYGMSRDAKWCDDCSQAERHKKGYFDPPRGPAARAG